MAPLVAGFGASVADASYLFFSVWAAAISCDVGSLFFLFFFALGTTITSRSMEMWTGFLEILTLSKD